jgi:TPR repeat protein
MNGSIFGLLARGVGLVLVSLTVACADDGVDAWELGRVSAAQHQACVAGDARACYDAGTAVHYLDDMSPPLGVDYYGWACELGGVDGCMALGNAFEYGEDVTEDPLRARVYYSQACDLGNARGCASAGDMSWTENDRPDNVAMARAYYLQACALDDETACRWAAGMIRRGEGGPADASRAQALRARACELNPSTRGCPGAQPERRKRED